MCGILELFVNILTGSVVGSQASNFMNYVAMNSAELGTNIVSIERVKEYSEIEVEVR